KARKLELTWLPSEPDWSRDQSFEFDAAGGRQLYLRIEKGAKAFGDYPLMQPYATVLAVEEFPQTVEIMHDGAVLALSGGRKLSVMARNLPAMQVQLARLLPGSIAHLASQTRGDFQKPYFAGSLGILDLAEVFTEVRGLGTGPAGEAQYEVV